MRVFCYRPVLARREIVHKYGLSISNGQCIIQDMARTANVENPPTGFVKTLKDLPFVRDVSFAPSQQGHPRLDGTLLIRTANERFSLTVVHQRSYLDRASLHAIIALAVTSTRPVILFARFVPRPSGEQLMAAGVNFIDQAGNSHILLGKRYALTVLGRPQPPKPEAERRVTSAQVQLSFVAAAEPTILTRPVREIAKAAGLSKSRAAELRQQLIADNKRQVPRSSAATQLRDLQERLLSGYAGVLRPKLVLGRFRAQEATAAEFLGRLHTAGPPAGIRFSLTGGPAAERLQHFYRGTEIPLFVDAFDSDVRHYLRLLPDRQGPVTLLRAFGELAFWKTVDGFTLAHPWLIYAELMHADDPRAHEAAEELRREYLSS